jgi:sporulation protein YlmC with PRC-barrel domain
VTGTAVGPLLFARHSDLSEEQKMPKISTMVAVAAILSAAAPLANAQTSPGSERHAAITRAASTHIIQPDQIRASKMLGSAVYDVQNRKIGSVKDLVLDKDGQVAAVVVDVGSVLGMGGKYVAVNLSDIKTDNNRLTLDRTKEQLQQMAEYQLDNPNTGAGTSASPVEGGRLGTGRGTTR